MATVGIEGLITWQWRTDWSTCNFCWLYTVRDYCLADAAKWFTEQFQVHAPFPNTSAPDCDKRRWSPINTEKGRSGWRSGGQAGGSEVLEGAVALIGKPPLSTLWSGGCRRPSGVPCQSGYERLTKTDPRLHAPARRSYVWLADRPWSLLPPPSVSQCLPHTAFNLCLLESLASRRAEADLVYFCLK